MTKFGDKLNYAIESCKDLVNVLVKEKPDITRGHGVHVSEVYPLQLLASGLERDDTVRIEQEITDNKWRVVTGSFSTGYSETVYDDLHSAFKSVLTIIPFEPQKFNNRSLVDLLNNTIEWMTKLKDFLRNIDDEKIFSPMLIREDVGLRPHSCSVVGKDGLNYYLQEPFDKSALHQVGCKDLRRLDAARGRMKGYYSFDDAATAWLKYVTGQRKWVDRYTLTDDLKEVTITKNPHLVRQERMIAGLLHEARANHRLYCRIEEKLFHSLRQKILHEGYDIVETEEGGTIIEMIPGSYKQEKDDLIEFLV